MAKKILITGGAGFVGSSLALRLKGKYPNYEIICFDNLKRRGSELNLTRLARHEIKFVHGDIRNKEDFDGVAKDVTTIIEASTEGSADASIMVVTSFATPSKSSLFLISPWTNVIS